MACYKRIYYVDYCEKDKRQTNAGFVKLVQWKEGGGTCFQLYISNLAAAEVMECQVKLLCGLHEVELGKVRLDTGKGMAQTRDLEKVLLELERDGHFEKVELQVVVNDDCWYECVIKEGIRVPEKSIKIEAAEVAPEAPAQQFPTLSDTPEPQEAPEPQASGAPALDAIEPQVPALEHPSPKAPVKETPPGFVPGIRHVKSDKWQQLWEVLPHIRPFEDEREYLQVELQDMVVLSGLFYRLVENSFLLHGYYNYGHLILTKIYKKGKERIYIGAPGNYYVKEAQVAVMFGFESFEPKAEPAREGDFGYYMIGVDI